MKVGDLVVLSNYGSLMLIYKKVLDVPGVVVRLGPFGDTVEVRWSNGVNFRNMDMRCIKNVGIR